MTIDELIEMELMDKGLGWIIAVKELQRVNRELQKTLEAVTESLASHLADHVVGELPIPEEKEEELTKVEKISLPDNANGRYCIAPMFENEGGGQCGKVLVRDQRFFCSTAHAQRWRKRHPHSKPTAIFRPPVRTFLPDGEGWRK